MSVGALFAARFATPAVEPPIPWAQQMIGRMSRPLPTREHLI